MGVMIDGRWEPHETLSALTNPRGEYVRAESVFRNRIEEGQGAPHPPAAGRYHVFLAKT